MVGLRSVKFWSFFGVFALFSFGVLGEDSFKEEDDVIVLTDKNYEEVIMSQELLLVEFYAPWCGHCKSLAPEYAKAAKELKKLDPPIRIAKVDATTETKIAEKFEIQGFPTLKLFKKSTDPSAAKEFDGGRTAEDIVSWLKKKSGPAVRVVESLEQLKTHTDSHEVVVLAVVDKLEGEQRDLMEKVGSSHDDHAFFVSTNKEIAEKYKPKEGESSSVVMFKSFDDKEVRYDGKMELAALNTWVKENSTPLIMTFSQEKASKIFGGDTDVHLLMFTDDSKPYHKKLVDAATHSATEHKGKMLHIVIPPSEDRILDYFGYKESDLPAVVLVNMAKGMKKYQYTLKGEELVADLDKKFKEDLLAFEKSYFDGKLVAKLKSAEPVDDKSDAVKTIVGKDFKERVVDSDKDVLLEFYAPWCGHCKSLAPKYEELAEKFAGVESIMIAKMDATENEVDHPGVDVQGFPTIIFFPAGKKDSPIDYDGDRDVKGFTAFLKKNAAKQFELDGEKHGGKKHDEL